MIPKNRRWQNFKPIGKRVLVALEEEDELISEGGVVLTKHFRPKNHFRLLVKADDCNKLLKTNDMLLINRLNNARKNTFEFNANEEVYLLPESEIIAVMRGDELKPLGDFVLIKRLNRDEMLLNSKIIIPEGIQSKDQTLEGVVVSFGLVPKPDQPEEFIEDESFFGPLKLGDHIQIKSWETYLIELNYNGSYHLVVPRKDVVYIKQDTDSIHEK